MGTIEVNYIRIWLEMLIQKSVCYEYPVQSFFYREEDREGNETTSLYPIKTGVSLMTAIDHYVRS